MNSTIVVVTFASHAAARTDTAFTYQGELKENGDLAAGSCNMDFSLWGDASAGNQIARRSS